MQKFISLLVLWLVGLSIGASPRGPIISGDLPDPTAIEFGGKYYMAATSSEWAPHFPIFRSDNLVDWHPIGHVFSLKPSWTKNSFWAPEWFVHNGKIYIYYTARKAADGISCIGVATADSPEGPFTDRGIVVEFGKEAIDPALIVDDGQLYISWKAYGLDSRPIELLACKLSDDGLALAGEPFSLLVDDENIGMEGQYWWKEGEYYYILYATGGCCGPGSDYAVCAARSKSLEGPYEKCPANPILRGANAEVASVGHGTPVTAADGRRMYICHSYLVGEEGSVGRQPVMFELVLGRDAWPEFVGGADARVNRVADTARAQKPGKVLFSDDFTSAALRPEWSWNYPFADVRAANVGGCLDLSFTPAAEVPRPIGALCLRPQSSGYVIKARIAGGNGGVVLYGDDNNNLTFGVDGDGLKLTSTRSGVAKIVGEVKLPCMPIGLKMTVCDGEVVEAAWSADGDGWCVLVDDGSLNGAGYNCWDRVARPGVYAEGPEKALFDKVVVTSLQ